MPADRRDTGRPHFWRTLLGELWQMFLSAPFGGVVLAAGVIFAFWTNSHLNDLAAQARGEELEAVVEALRIGAVALWVSVALWGRQIMASARTRQEARARFDYHDSVIERINEALRREDEVKQEVTKKSRSFWDRFRSEPQL